MSATGQKYATLIWNLFVPGLFSLVKRIWYYGAVEILGTNKKKMANLDGWNACANLTSVKRIYIPLLQKCLITAISNLPNLQSVADSDWIWRFLKISAVGLDRIIRLPNLKLKIVFSWWLKTKINTAMKDNQQTISNLFSSWSYVAAHDNVHLSW